MCRVCRDAGSEKTDGVVRFVEKGYALADDVAEVLFAISRDGAL